MADEIKLDEPLPNRVIETAEAIYAPPEGGSDAYWRSLETRIMARVADSVATGARWWVVVGGWARAGLVAAAAVIVALVVGALMAHAHQQELRTAYESATGAAVADSVSVPSGALSERDGPDTRGATFRDVISH